ncbi:Condensin complex subunit 3 [Hyphodiscus hymeniophilus]|uniref:Condensin complex subunit 3 n=1 Tax=Hyphodiscus hymeniophilus TaxID=353542 RepID=A0A9P6VEY2_9HELO|nr:Condensin complex subunit 3 [Hyphodiscus hymeniophilus]
MPGRVSTTRTSRTSTAVSHKSSVQSLNFRGSTASRASSTQVQVPDEMPDNELRTEISSIFRDAQRTTASHRKLVITLRKIHEACCYEPTSNRKNKTNSEDFDEEQFTSEFIRCVLRVMPVKKSESVGERSIRFIGMFLRHANEKDNDLNADDAEEGVMVETPSSRLTAHLMNTVLPLLTSKDKFVRYRSTQLISHIINSLDSIDDDLFQLLRHGLLKRIRDKEAMVRVQAVLGLGRLAGNEADEEAEDSDDDSGAGLLDKLLDVLQNDPSADVRRSLLVNLPILPNTLPFLLERARDQDPATRRALYSRLLPALGDFRHLSLSMREKLLRWGLRDRDENVRKAAGKLFRERWIEDCAGTAGSDGADEAADGEAGNRELKGPSFDGLLELLERIDVVNSGVENGVALEAMKGFWEGRPDYRDDVTFDDNFWDTLTAESVFMARSFNDFCRSEGNGNFEALIEEKMPEVTKLAFYLQRYITVLVETMKRIATEEVMEDEEEEDTVEQEFIVEQLLHIARTLDYSDEVGRRKMFALLRQSLSVPDLPEEVTKLTVEVLRGICAGDAAGEREFCSVVLEAVADVHDTIMDEPLSEDVDESFHSARSEVSGDTTPTRSNKSSKKSGMPEEDDQEKAVREIMVNMKCLHIVQCMLEHVEGNLQQNVDLVAMLNNLVVPAVRSHEAPVRERGLVCLGLSSLLDKSLAEENLNLFMHFFAKGHSALQITALQILTDILNQHGANLLDSNPTVVKMYLKALKSGSKTPEVQAAATVAIAKLMLGRVISEASVAVDDLLRTLVVLYFDPSTAHNQGVRQTLSYFLPVYSFSRKENQDRMRKVALDALHKLFEIQETLDDEGDTEAEMVSLSTVGAHLVDWTDPRKCYVSGDQLTYGNEGAKKAVNGDVHLEFARDLLEKLGSNVPKEEKKTLAPLLAKLYISPASTEPLIREIYQEVSIAIEDKLISDATGRNALYKIHVSLGKIVNNMPEKGTTRMKSSTPLAEDKPSLGDDESEEKTEILKVEAEAEVEVEKEDEATALTAGVEGSRLTQGHLPSIINWQFSTPAIYILIKSTSSAKRLLSLRTLSFVKMEQLTKLSPDESPNSETNLSNKPPSESTSNVSSSALSNTAEEASTVTTSTAVSHSPVMTTSPNSFVPNTYGHLITTTGPDDESDVAMIERIQSDLDHSREPLTAEEKETHEWLEENLEMHWGSFAGSIHSEMEENLRCEHCKELPRKNVCHQTPPSLEQKLLDVIGWRPDDYRMPLEGYLESITPKLQALEKEYYGLVFKGGCEITTGETAKNPER